MKRHLTSDLEAAGTLAAGPVPRRPLWLTLAPALFLLLWSGGFSVAKLGLQHSPPLTFLVVRFALTLAVLLPVALVVRPPLPESRAAWRDLTVVGFLIQAGYFGLCYLAYTLGAPAGTVAIVVSLQPILVGLLAPRFTGERVTLGRWIGLVLGLAGAGAVVLTRSEVGGTSTAGMLCCVGALLAMTGAALYEKRRGGGRHPVMVNLIQYAVGLVVMLPLAAAFETMHIEWTWSEVASMAYLVIGNSLVAVSLLLAMIRHGEVSRVSALFFLVPPLAALMAWGLLGEVLPPLAWGGMALAALGVAIASRAGSGMPVLRRRAA